MEQKNRTHPRLKGHDYSQSGSYFVTVCSKDKQHIFGYIAVGRDDPGAPCARLTPIGGVVEKYILSINGTYENVSVDKYVVMPNHIHILLTIGAAGAPGSSRPTNEVPAAGAPGSSRPTVSQVISALKRFTNKETGQKLWQTSFYDHIIRDENDYLTRWNYIDTNPVRWTDDEYY